MRTTCIRELKLFNALYSFWWTGKHSGISQNYTTTQHCPRPHVSFAVNKAGTLFHRDAAGNPLMISGEDFGKLKCYVPFNWKILFNMTQLPSSKKPQDLTKSPELFLCGGNASNCLWQQTARDSKTGKQGLHYNSCPESQTSFFFHQGKYLSAQDIFSLLRRGRRFSPQEKSALLSNLLCVTEINPE